MAPSSNFFKPSPSSYLLMGILALLLLALIPEHVTSQNCGCAAKLCCSKHGYCGKGNDYCGEGCREGPCISKSTPSAPANNGGSVAKIVTPAFFNGIKSKAAGNCAGKSFYTRDAFLKAVGSYPNFGKGGSAEDSKREIAAFFAQITHETGSLCYVEEIDKSNAYCDPSNTVNKCVPGKKYYGRGPIQLTGNGNYGAAGKAIGFDGLRAPEKVSKDPVISFKTALWFWMENVHAVVKQGFGATTRKINGPLECDGKQPGKVQSRITHYQAYCKAFGVAPGGKLAC